MHNFNRPCLWFILVDGDHGRPTKVSISTPGVTLFLAYLKWAMFYGCIISKNIPKSIRAVRADFCS